MDDYQPGRELESINLEGCHRSCTRITIGYQRRIWLIIKTDEREVQAGAVYIKVFVYFTCVYVLVYEVPKSPWPGGVLIFIENHYQIYKNFPFLLILILYLAISKYCKNQTFKLSSVNWNC